MRFTNKVQTKLAGQTELLDSVIQRGYIVRNLANVLLGRVQVGPGLVLEQVDQSGLSSFDLAREDCLLPYIHVDE